MYVQLYSCIYYVYIDFIGLAKREIPAYFEYRKFLLVIAFTRLLMQAPSLNTAIDLRAAARGGARICRVGPYSLPDAAYVRITHHDA